MYIKPFGTHCIVQVTPIHYDLTFEPIFSNFTFEGKETIDVKITKPTSTITLNSAELKIKKCTVESAGKSYVGQTILDEKNEALTIKIPGKINKTATIRIEFSGILNDRLVGFYRSQYKDKSGKTKYLATTQFEAADARRAFPCWDEPAAKATFSISIIAESNHTAISNTNQILRKKLGKKTLYKFAKTPIMSTYLVYLGVGEFEFLSTKSGKVTMRIVTTKGNSKKGKFALDLCKKLVQSYEDYFGIKYPLPKLDLIAVPDFASGAMENWGAITFRETILLFDEKTSSTQTKQYIAEVVSHELAHQWFGNLVTMEWWNDLWLNESFATFMATKFVDKFYPEWKLWDQFLEDTMNTAMGLDALHSSHPIDVKVNSPSEIREIFDAISYDKGGCVLKMLESFVTEKNFRAGLRTYLKKFSYKNAQGNDLWDEIGRAAKMPVRSMVNSWLKQTGFPLVDVQKQGSHLILSQKRFILEKKGTAKGLWEIPVVINDNGAITSKILRKKQQAIPVKSEQILVNPGRNGFYRVKYSQDIMYELKEMILQKSISHIDRWAIQNDLFALCVSSDGKTSDYLDFASSYENEDDYLTQSNVSGNLYALYHRTIDESYNSEIQQIAQRYLRNMFDSLGWDAQPGEPHTNALLRSFVIAALGKMDDEEILCEANNRFKQYLQKPDSLNPDIQDTVFSLAAWSGAVSYDKLLQLYKKAPSQEQKIRFLGALSSFKDPKLLLKTLDLSQSNDVRSQNMHIPIMRISANRYGKKILWPWLKKNWKKLRVKVGVGSPLLNRVVSSISAVADESMQGEIKQFFKKNHTPGTEMTLSQTLERIRIHSQFLKQLRAEFA
ncbi:M1 family metallopeptidase [Candidatus Nitrosotenuis aquarius]|uniref:M1 family metallopeptidase n=1 Tax=Candidatus Nitrosotenuis aquarius TaxID=1846278 RepID=UPI001FE2683B|nr:M1 family metallopeptidase [Candidatus Nitrosotenuis aquarius]